MKRVKDKYMINRTKYKDIKRYDHKQPVLFEKPIPARGRQGLWNWEEEDEQTE